MHTFSRTLMCVLGGLLLANITLASAAPHSWRALEPGAPALARLEWNGAGRPDASAAVLVVSGCGGGEYQHHYWREAIAGLGYVTATLQLAAEDDACASSFAIDAPAPPTPAFARRVDEALDVVRAQPVVRADRVAVLGFQRNGLLQVLAERPARAAEPRLAAGVAFAPDCRYPTSARFAVPALTISGGWQGEYEEWLCALMMRRAADGRAPVTRRVYPNASRDFARRALGDHGQASGADHSALVEATREVADYLRHYLRPEQDLASGSPEAAPGGPSGEHEMPAVLSGRDAADVPSRGHSLLDEVLAQAGGVPFPFDKLLARLRLHAGPGYFDRAALKQTVIPIGRSLQRDANRNDYFGSPRVVVAVDTEPADPQRQLNLKDRLFLGYQPAASVVEAISWNPSAGRFEFQVIEDYRDGGTPRLRHANRALCLSCHHNAAPMFSRAPWSETDANPRIAARLDRHVPGRPAMRLNTTVEHIDAATDRASLMSQVQHIWRLACPADTAVGRACRAAWVKAMLQYRLSGNAAFERGSVGYQEGLRDYLVRRWQALWPHGVAVSTADLPDHDPLVALAPGHVPAHVDPLTRRPRALVWRQPDDTVMTALVRSLSGLLDQRLVQRLDDFLATSAGHRPGRQVTMACRLSEQPVPAPLLRLRARCTEPAVAPDAAAGSAMEIEFVARGSRVVEGVGRGLVVSGQDLRRVAVLGGRLLLPSARAQRVAMDQGRMHDPGRALEERHRQKTLARLVLAQQGGRGRLRLPSGRSVRIAELEFDGGPHAQLRLLASDDFSGLAAVIEELALRASPSFSSPVFRPAMLMAEIYARLGLGPGPLVPAKALQPLVHEQATAHPAPRPGDANLTLLERTCGRCHSSPSVSPPGFLHGDSDAVRAQVRLCAPRMLARLAAWQQPLAARSRAPMPPPGVLPLLGHDPERWIDSMSYRRLLRYLKEIAGVSSGSAGVLAADDASCVRLLAGRRP